MQIAFVKIVRKKQAVKLLGERIRKLRLKQNISQAQLAFEAEISREQLLRIENGNYNTTYFTLYKICIALNIEFKELFEFLEK